MTRQSARILLMVSVILTIAGYLTPLIKINPLRDSIHAQKTAQRENSQKFQEPNKQIIEALGYIPKEGADLSRVTTQISQSF